MNEPTSLPVVLSPWTEVGSVLPSRIARHLVMSRLEQIEFGTLTVVESGVSHVFGRSTSGPRATVHMHHPDAWTAIALGGSPAQRERWLPRLALGEAIGTVANAGGAALFLGSAGGLGDIVSDGASGNTIGCGANETGDEFGYAIAIGDFNADGFDDAVAGIPGEDADAGAICVVAGAANPSLAASGTPFLSSDLFTLAIAQSERMSPAKPCSRRSRSSNSRLYPAPTCSMTRPSSTRSLRML